MPSLPHNLDTRSLRTYLSSVLPDARLTVATADSPYQPLLLLQTKHVMAAFAFANGEIRKSYEALYGKFKNYYAEQRGQWDALDLAFVFCVQPGVPNLDEFCSTVETDVYFCRKFVVPLTPQLGMSLARLPFLPLTPLHGRSLRPPSAQTFLQQCGVLASLAKFIVVQHERSPEGIVEDCASGEFGVPRELTPAANAPVVYSDTVAEPVRLESVTIKNFRAYRQPQTFVVGADVTVLYGPNGFGKTSFFDAIDFAVTGGIGRIESSNARFAKMAQHLDSKSEESVVSLSFACNGNMRSITRSVSDRKRALLDGRPTDRKTILAEVTRGAIPAADRVENFVSLFRATHLFSQEQQELTKDFHDDCRLSSQLVSRMLAFEDYANAVNKAARVRDVLQTVIANANAEINELSGQITEDKKELERLGQTAKAHTNVEALDTEIETLRSKLVAAGIATASQKPDAATVRGWRASLEARHGDSQSRTARLSALAKEVAGLPRMRTEITSLQTQRGQKEQALAAAEEKRIAAELALQNAELRLADVKTRCSEAQTHDDTLEWVRTTKPLYVQLTERLRTITDELNLATAALVQHRATEEQAAGDLRMLENRAAEAAAKLKTKSAELEATQNLKASSLVWQANLARLTASVQSEQAAMNSLESLRAEERELSPQVSAFAAEEAHIRRLIAESEKGQSELNTLVSQLQGHIHDGTCPLCGEDHGSKEELIRRIKEHVAVDAASAARTELAVVREKAKGFAERLTSNKQMQAAADAQLATLKMERARLDAEIAQFANSAAQLGVITESLGATAEQLQSRQNRLQIEINGLNRLIQGTGVSVDGARSIFTNAKNIVAAKTAETTDRQTALTRLHEEINRLRNDSRLTQISLDIDPEQLAGIKRLNLEQLAEFKAEVAENETEVTQKKPEVITLQQESASLKTQISVLRTQLTNLQNTATQICARLEQSKLPPDATEDMLLSLIAEESRAEAQFLALRDSASNIELAIDAATTAAALTGLLNNLRNKEKAVATATSKRDQHQPWLKYFDELTRIVSSQQNEAIANFTIEYGPRTSVIQRRLRAVYGFDEVEIHSDQSEITVRVKRHGEELRPTDYFSQSQQQTLLLGLFLTACSSQTWSAFSPVFLDDAVTHFDDLNTYAFLDLLVGLLDADFGKRQFIISTCDEKLLQLARQKFRHLGERASFYRFTAFGPEGPTVSRLDGVNALQSTDQIS